MTEKLDKLLKFITENRKYNKQLQQQYYRALILPYNNKREKIISLLYHIANTQSQPKIDKLASSYQTIINDPICLNSFEVFVRKINIGGIINYSGLFDGMVSLDGWGNKTSALFCKAIYHLHNCEYDNNLRIWSDAPSVIDEDDRLYLPVDAVIIAIFNKLDSSRNWDFNTINSKLEKHSKQQIEIWDDLWFWGFITQYGTGDSRIFDWNENKYWGLKETDKNPLMIKEIKNKCSEFLGIFDIKLTN